MTRRPRGWPPRQQAAAVRRSWIPGSAAILCLTVPMGAALAAPLRGATPGGATRSSGAPSPRAHASSRPPASFPLYQRLLDGYLHVISRPGEPLATGVDYAALHAPAGAALLAAVRTELLGVTPSRLDARARLAWAINTYNALVIEQIARVFDSGLAADVAASTPRSSTRSGVLALTRGEQTFFEFPVVTIEARDYSLNAFETHFVFADVDRASGGASPPSLDPRAHFALVCGARGCPPLQPRAFTPDSLDTQLDAAARAALASPSHLRLDPASGRLEASEIFSWYAADFGGASGAFAFLRRYAPDAARREIDRRGLTTIAGKIPWDWSFNAVPPQRSGAR